MYVYIYIYIFLTPSQAETLLRSKTVDELCKRLGLEKEAVDKAHVSLGSKLAVQVLTLIYIYICICIYLYIHIHICMYMYMYVSG